jgi:hypothetical protein
LVPKPGVILVLSLLVLTLFIAGCSQDKSSDSSIHEIRVFIFYHGPWNGKIIIQTTEENLTGNGELNRHFFLEKYETIKVMVRTSDGGSLEDIVIKLYDDELKINTVPEEVQGYKKVTYTVF